MLPLSELETASPGTIVERQPDELAALLYTGGTTGRAKGVMLTHANLAYTGAAAQRGAHIPGVFRGLVTLPLSHAYGLLVTLSGLHSPEAPVAVLTRWFDPAAFLELVQEHEIQQSALVPTMFGLLLSQPLEEYRLDSLAWVSSGRRAPGSGAGARVPPPGAVGVDPPGLRPDRDRRADLDQPGRSRARWIGWPAGAGHRGADPRRGRTAAARRRGRRGLRPLAGVMQGYWNAPEITAEALDDGWLRTGDLGYVDEDGYLFIVDRKKDLIIRGGFNVYPRDVEDALLEHPRGRARRRRRPPRSPPRRGGGGVRVAARRQRARCRGPAGVGAGADRRLPVSRARST